MDRVVRHPAADKVIPPVRRLAEQALSRTAGAPLIPGNEIRLLKDAKENYPAWLEAMRSAKKSIHFESFIIHEDDIGEQFSQVLAAKAQEGVSVRLIYDWLGAFGKTSRKFWERLRKAGVEVRCFNPFRFDNPVGWLSRDHRKMISVDGEIGFVTGLCVGRMWVGYPERGIEPWRDTGVVLRGPAVADVEHAFADIWATMGSTLPEDEMPRRETIPAAGDVTLQVVASVPNTAGLYRLDQFITAIARKSLWLTDAYFVGMVPYVQSLSAAARDGVDVRLLVPGSTDIPVLRAFSRAGYQPLLEAGARVFEWNGPMIHAKTAVADGRWARVGSTNLNLSSWIGNYELDVAVENEAFAQAMEELYLDDLGHATEIVLNERQKVRPVKRRASSSLLRPRLAEGSVSRAGASAIRISNTVGAAIANRRVLGPAEARIMGTAGMILLLLTIVGLLWPRWVVIPFSVITGWLAISLFVRAFKLHRKRSLEINDRSGLVNSRPARHASARNRRRIGKRKERGAAQ
ncbi:MAG TPA: phospholipase D-like domain-containing protein [Syntrophorhabdales bacterium]|nr:phospholipase D-like domain-containing protein [Syntrophorhabdales bacterium]